MGRDKEASRTRSNGVVRGMISIAEIPTKVSLNMLPLLTDNIGSNIRVSDSKSTVSETFSWQNMCRLQPYNSNFVNNGHTVPKLLDLESFCRQGDLFMVLWMSLSDGPRRWYVKIERFSSFRPKIFRTSTDIVPVIYCRNWISSSTQSYSKLMSSFESFGNILCLFPLNLHKVVVPSHPQQRMIVSETALSESSSLSKVGNSVPLLTQDGELWRGELIVTCKTKSSRCSTQSFTRTWAWFAMYAAWVHGLCVE